MGTSESGESGEIGDLSARALAEALRRRELTPREAVDHFLARIATLDGPGGAGIPDGLGAFATMTADAARDRADRLGAGDPDGPLWGVPTADKDLVARAGVPTRYGSALFTDFVPAQSDPLAVAVDAVGAISLGKTSTPEFGMTGYTETRIGPPARNPWDPGLGAAGSSGGAAVAVATGMLPLAPASDGGGSIRIPAATVGVVGVKPSRGRLPVGSGLDFPGGLPVAGPIARSVADAAFLLDALAGSLPYPFATRAPDGGPFLDAALAEAPRARIGATTTSPWDDAEDIRLDPESARGWRRGIELLTGAGHDVEDAGWRPEGYPEMFRTMWRVGAARLPVPDEDLDRLEPITAWLAREGRALPARRALDALAAATTFERETIAAFAPFDAILMPALALRPQPIGWYDAVDAERSFVQQVQYSPFTSFVNVSGLPAVVVRIGTGPDGLPTAVQLIGRPGGERTILALAAQLESLAGAFPRWTPASPGR